VSHTVRAAVRHVLGLRRYYERFLASGSPCCQDPHAPGRVVSRAMARQRLETLRRKGVAS